ALAQGLVMNIRSVLEKMIAARASDLHLKAGTSPVVRVDGVLYTLDDPAPSAQDLRDVSDQLLNDEQRLYFSTHNEIDFAFRMSFIHQREVGLDTQSFLDGLRYVLRQDPDIILIGEIRNLETMNTALMAADTGHLVMSTLHTTDVVQTLQRIVSFYPPHQHEEVRLSVASNLRAVVCQRLIPRKDGAGRVPAVEIMVNTPTIREYILSPDKTLLVGGVVADGTNQYGMQTFDQSVMHLLREGLISEEEALRNCTNPNEF